RVLELFHLRHHLGRERVAEQLLRFLKLTRQTAVERARLLELLLDRRGRVLELLHLIGEIPLILRDRLRLLGRIIAHRALLAAVVVRVALSILPRTLRSVTRGIAGTLLERLLRRRRRLRLADG